MAIGDWFQSGVGAPITDEFTTKAMQSWITFDTKLKIFKSHIISKTITGCKKRLGNQLTVSTSDSD